MFLSRSLIFLFLLILPGMAWTQPMGLAEVIREVLSKSPDIPLNQINTDFTRVEQQRIEGMLDPSISTRITISDEKKPTTNPFAANKTRFGQVSGSITKPLQNGSTLTGSLDYNRTKLDYPPSVPSNFQSTTNPTYQHQIDLSYRYPLLRGHGNPAYHEQMAASKQDELATRWRVEILKEQLTEQVINQFFQLMSDNLSVQLAADAVGRAKKLLAYQKMREQLGLIEQADRLQAEALLATRRMELGIAEAALHQGKTNLNRLMLRSPDMPLHLNMGEGVFPLANTDKITLDKLLAEAEKSRPIFRVINANLSASNARLSAARNQHETQIDLVGQLGSRALGGNAGDILGQGFTLNDRFASVSLELSDTITGNATRASIRQAELARQQAVLERIQARESVKSELAMALTRLKTTQNVVNLAKQRAISEKSKFDTEMTRYREGRSDTATVIQFEGELQSARLQASIQQVSLKLASYQLALAHGTLLAVIERSQVPVEEHHQ